MVDPDQLAEDRAEIERMIARARRNTGTWWPEAIARMEAALEVPDLGAAQRAWSYGHHVRDDLAEAECKGYRP